MKHKRTLTLAAAVAALALAAPSGAAAAPHCQFAGKTPTHLSKKHAKEAITCLINEQRRARGIGPLVYNRRLGRAAQAHSASMDRANYYSHGGTDGSMPADRARRAGYMAGARSWGVGENIFWGWGRIGTPKHIVRGWMHSPPHRASILSRAYEHLGVGFAHGSPGGGREGRSGTYTADFGYRR